MVAEIEAAKADGDTLGGVVEVLVYGLPPGLGSFVHADRRLDARLAGALMGIQAIKGVEVGDGFATARRRGSSAHDEIDPRACGVTRRSNRAGGIEGGMTNGEVLRVRAAMKPISTVPRALATLDVATGEEASRSTSAATSARCRRPAWSPRRWWPSSSPTRWSRSSAGTRLPRFAGTLTAICATLVDTLRPAPDGVAVPAT